jgi:transposase-like protein
MPQIQLPIFPAGTTEINAKVAFDCRDGKVTYLNGHLPVFQHAQNDIAGFRLFTTQLVENGTVSQAEIARAFHVPSRTVKRYVKRYREGGTKSFFVRPRQRSESVLMGEIKEQAQGLLDEGYSVPEVARRVKVLPNTLHKAIRSGRLHQPKKRV